MKLPVFELKINTELTDESEVSYISLVDEPAIMKDYLVFKDEFVNPQKGEKQDEFMQRCIKYVIDEGKEQQQAIAICNSLWENHFAADSYNDYPQEATENAKIALRWAEENGWGDCGEATGKQRANQLANRENITRDTIARMASFARHKQNSDKPLGDGCGRLMWLAWGGDAGIDWAQRKLEQIDNMQSDKTESNKMKFQIVSEEKRIISGAIMIADELIYRKANAKIPTDHYVKFSAETIKEIAIKFSKRKYQANVNLMHDQKVEGVTMFESWLVDKSRGIKPMAGFEDVTDGSWFGSFYVENDEVWSSIKAGTYKGFSVEGLFDYTNPMTYEEQILQKLKNLLFS